MSSRLLNWVRFWLGRPVPFARQRLDDQRRFIVDSPLARALARLEVKSQSRAANARLPVTRPAEARFGRRERVQHSIGRT